MKSTRICITGGMGFIGTELRKQLKDADFQGRILIVDNLHPQIHGEKPSLTNLRNHEELLHGDVSSKSTWEKIAHWSPDTIFHLAAETGTGQSMYQPSSHVSTNLMGVAYLNEYVESQPKHIRENLRIILTSSRAVYGEGSYHCLSCGSTGTGLSRSKKDLEEAIFQPRCRACNSSSTEAVPTHESAQTSPASTYGFTKLGQEFLLDTLRNRVKSVVTTRLQNVYGDGQSLKNPYTGILAIFTSLLKQNVAINIFEDGIESRDFVHVSDICAGLLSAATLDESPATAINLGTGVSVAVKDVAHLLANILHANPSLIRITGDARVGDIRHNIADISLARSLLKFEPKVQFKDGLERFVRWTNGFPSEESFKASYTKSIKELSEAGLFVSK